MKWTHVVVLMDSIHMLRSHCDVCFEVASSARDDA